jgi:protein arginine N-methyltransferase 2
MDLPEADLDLELQTQQILLAASSHDLDTLRSLLRTGSANVQDPDTGYTPLHSAIAACEPSPPASPKGTNGTPETHVNGDFNGADIRDANLRNGHADANNLTEFDSAVFKRELLEPAEKTLKLLFQNGAIWNDVDKNNETPGCIAYRMGLTSLYELVVDAGVRAEMLLNRLDGYELLQGEDSDEEEKEPPAGTHSQPGNTHDATEATATSESHDATENEHGGSDQHTTLPDTEGVTSELYLSSNLTFGEDRILDQETNGVMMAWETEIMQRTVDLLIPRTGLSVLNIGHGMGIIDGFFQDKSPALHHIIEAHPTILAQMRKNGWDQKRGVTIHEGRWQDIVPKLIENGILFDAIYFDTFAEDYKALHLFFEESVIGLLNDNGKWGFFNGLGADRQVCYDVYSKVVEIDLLEAGYDVEWEVLNIQDLKETNQWEGVRRPYWQLEKYRLPICTFIG